MKHKPMHSNLTGSVLRVTTRYNNLYPYDVFVKKGTLRSCFSPVHDNGSVCNQTIQYELIGGFAVDLFRNLQEVLGFRYVLVPEVGPYNFSLGEEMGIDLYLGSYSLYFKRALIVDPTFVVGKSRIVAFLNHDFEGFNQSIFFLPFSFKLWCGLFFMLILIFVIIGFFGILEKVPRSDITLLTFSIALQRDIQLKLNKSSFRIALLTTATFMTMIMSCYTGNMFSIKAVRVFALNSIEAIGNSQYKILLELGFENSSIRLMFESLAHLPIVAKLLVRIKETKYVHHSFAKSFQEVAHKQSAYILDEETGMSTIKQEIGYFPCSWSGVPVLKLNYPWSMFQRKNSPYKTSINFLILRMDERGVIRRMRKTWIPRADECKGNSISSFESIRMHQVYSAFVILAVGMLIAIFWLVIVERRCLFFY